MKYRHRYIATPLMVGLIFLTGACASTDAPPQHTPTPTATTTAKTTTPEQNSDEVQDSPTEDTWQEQEILEEFTTPTGTRLLGEPEENMLDDVHGWSATLEIPVGGDVEKLEEEILNQLEDHGLTGEVDDLGEDSGRIITAEGEGEENFVRYSIEMIAPSNSSPGTIYWLAAKTPLRDNK